MALPAMPATAIAKPAPSTCLRRIPTSNSPVKLSQTVFAFDFRNRQSADARQWPAAVGDCNRDHDLVGARRVVDLHFHAVEMTAHEGRVLVPERNVERGPRSTALLRRRDQRRALAQDLAHRRAHLRMQDRRRMFEFAVFADSSGLAVAVRLGTVDAECRDSLLRKQIAELLADFDQLRQILDIPACKRILDHRDRSGPPRRRRNPMSHLEMGFLDHRDDLANDRAHCQPRSRSNMRYAFWYVSMKRRPRTCLDPCCTHHGRLAK